MYNVTLKCLKSPRRNLLIFHLFQKHKRRSTWYWITDEWLCWERRTPMWTTDKVDFKLFPWKWNSHYSSAPVLFDLGLVCTTIYGFVEFIPVKCFNKFLLSAVNALWEGDENPNSIVVAETMKLLSNSSYGYQIEDRCRHTVTKYCTMRKHMGLSTQNCSSVWITSMIYCRK